MKSAPDPKDVLEFQFKELSNFKISDGFESVPAACNLVAVDKKRGLIYSACNNKIVVLKSGDTSDKDWRREHLLSGKISRLELNCDCSFLAVTLLNPTAYIYSAASFTQQNLELLREIKLSSTENVHVLDLRWNPCNPGALCTITSDYTVGSFNITADNTPAILTIVEKLEKLEVSCVAWSPKGKQLVVGCKNGGLLQLKPDLKVARNIAGPNPSIGSIISLLWISSYQFCAAYLDSRDSRINVLIIDAPKGEANATFTSYEDITYGSPGVEGEENGLRYYFDYIPEWGLIVAAGSGSSEVAVLGSRDHGTTWEQWQLVDSGRAQLPLVRTSESYPVGLAVDKTSVNKLSWGGEGSTLPYPVPILHILGTSGQLCSFHMVNLMPGMPDICSSPTEVIPSTNQPRMSLAPTEISFNLTAGITSTPRPKQIEVSQEKPKPATAVTLFADTPRTPVPQPPAETQLPKPEIETIELPPKVEMTIASSKEINQQQEKIGIDHNLCIQAYQEEWNSFERDLKSRKELQVVDIGSATERKQLIDKSETMERFLTELQEITASLTSDISYLKALLLQTFAWIEESKSRSLSDSSINIQSHGDKDNLKELRNQMYYAQNQLEQATRALDLEWLEHINKEKSKMKVPRLEYVYQNMLRHSQIITKEKNDIQVLVRKWKILTRGDVTSSLNKSITSMSLLSLTGSGINNTNGVIEQRCRTIASRNCSFSREKQSKLRNLLNQSATRIIKAATPSPIQDRLKETLSALATLSPPKQVQERKPKFEFSPKPEQVIPAATPPTQTAKSPLAALDRIVASIGSTPAQPNVKVQTRAPASNPVSVSPQIIKIPQVDTKARAAAAAPAPQIPAPAQPKLNKPISVSLFGTPPMAKSVSAIPSTMKPAPVSEVSPFTSSASRMSAPPTLLPSLIPTTVTTAPVSKPLSKIDATPLDSTNVKTDVPSIIPTPLGTSSSNSSLTITGVPVSVALPQPNPQSSFSFSSPTTSTSQLPSYPTMLKSSTTVAATTSTSPKVSPLQSFSFASKPTGNTPFSFASKPITSPASGVAPSLDLSAMGLGLQAPANTSVENVTPVTTVTNVSSPGSIFGGASSTTEDKTTTGSIFGNSGFPSLFSGSTAGGNATSIFGGGGGSTTTASTKPPIFGGGSSQTSIFGGAAANVAKSTTGEVSSASSTTPGFQSPPSTHSASVFGNISSTANSASIFGGNSGTILNTSALGGATTLPAQPFATATATPIKSPTFGGESATSTATAFGRPPDSTPSVFGGVSTNSATSSPFGSSIIGSSSTSIFGGALSSPPVASTFGGATSNQSAASTFGGTASNQSGVSPFGAATSSPSTTSTFGAMASNQSTASVFGSVLPASPNQSIFGGAALNTSPANSPSAAAAAPAFGQAATFGAKPEFGTMFGASNPVFGGGGFGASTFPAATQQPTNVFGVFNTSSMGGNIPAIGGGSMPKVFGQSSGSSTFENLATQEGGLTFGNLAQKQAEPAPAPAFSGKSSFQSWR